jgi:hypothetical protein
MTITAHEQQNRQPLQIHLDASGIRRVVESSGGRR